MISNKDQKLARKNIMEEIVSTVFLFPHFTTRSVSQRTDKSYCKLTTSVYTALCSWSSQFLPHQASIYHGMVLVDLQLSW